MTSRRAAAGALLAACAGAALAAGGHHAVDDATLLDPGQCELETWVSRSAGGQRLLHAGPGCRVGPVELSGAAEALARPSAREGQLQVKVAAPLAGDWSLGGSLTRGWSGGAAGERASSLLLLATWSRDPWAVHLNGGRDLVRHGPDQPRRGVAAEWTPHPQWQFVAERYDEQGGSFARAGIRYSLTPYWQLDASRAAHLHGTGSSLWTVGSTWQFGR